MSGETEWVPELRISDDGVTTVAQHLMRDGEILGSIVPTDNGCWKTRSGLIEAESSEETAKAWVEACWKGL